MPQEPWKRASQLKRAVPPEVRKPVPEVRFRRPSPWPGIALAVLILGVAGVAAWYFWLRDEQQVPEEVEAIVETVVPQEESRPYIVAEELDRGLGIALAIFGDYRDLLEATKDKGIEWKMAAAGDSIRMSAPGVQVYVTDSVITAFTLDVSAIFGTKEWKWWHGQLKAAGISPETTAPEATGHESTGNRVTLTSTRSQKLAEGWGSPAYELTFDSAGLLLQLKGGISFGVSEQAGPSSTVQGG